ncbi:MAG TPA: hypothetical protein VK447_12110, partial [Myxococcaceae bacterium]|nr:hypothetical protein [Myxococcaceae bacterium]
MERIRNGGAAVGAGGRALRQVGALLALLALMSVVGCTYNPGERDEAAEIQEATATSALVGSVSGEVTIQAPPGLTTNGLALSGLMLNGVIGSGLTVNGLTHKALQQTSFRVWFEADPAYAAMVMRYLVTCAVESGETRTYGSLGASHTWTGALGLATGWASGAAITEDEEQRVTACLAAHANKYGLQVPLLLQGRAADGELLTSSDEDQATYSEEEACFFGNLFRGEGVYSGSDRSLNELESTARACGLSSHGSGLTQTCAPMVRVGSCSNLCT